MSQFPKLTLHISVAVTQSERGHVVQGGSSERQGRGPEEGSGVLAGHVCHFPCYGVRLGEPEEIQVDRVAGS